LPKKFTPKKGEDFASNVSTVVASPTSTQLTDDVLDDREQQNKMVTTPQTNKLQRFAYQSAKNLEEADPIVDDDIPIHRPAPLTTQSSYKLFCKQEATLQEHIR
jgi:hypothetical protein